MANSAAGSETRSSVNIANRYDVFEPIKTSKSPEEVKAALNKRAAEFRKECLLEMPDLPDMIDDDKINEVGAQRSAMQVVSGSCDGVSATGSVAVDAGVVASHEKVDMMSTHHLNILLTHMPSVVKSIAEEEEWIEIEMGVDSGASETVIGPDMISNVELKEGEHKRRGVQYEVATGELIPNLGEKRFVAVSENNVARKLTSQVADVNQALLSVRKMMASGHRIIFDSDGSYIEDKTSGEYMDMRDDGSMFLLKLWVQKEGF